MADPLHSASWYRVAGLRPRLRDHARVHRHRYRGQRWYVLQDPYSGRSHRLRPAVWFLLGLMDGRRTTQDIWEGACNELGDDVPSQDETIRLLGMLHSVDLLRCDVSPDTSELLRRTQRAEKAEWWRRYTQPFSVRIPLLDPDALLDRWAPRVSPLFSRGGAWAAALLVVTGALVACAHAPELSAGASERLLSPGNLLLLGVIYPLLKAAHELGHAFATKRWGGEVHEMGILLLFLFPIPYVDASASAAFADKWKRIAVGAAGIVVEAVAASVACLVWVLVEPGMLRTVAWDVMWIAGASALLFNGNPLLRFDGYYILSDWIEIPNLRARSRQYLAYLCQRHVFGLQQVRDPVTAAGEPGWFVGWGLAAAAYRIVLVFSIALFVAERFFFLGVLLAVFALAVQVVAPLLGSVDFVMRNPRLGGRRGRALVISGVAVAGLLVLVLAVPLPLATYAQGVVWPPEGAQVRVASAGFVEALMAEPGARVRAGQPLLRLREPFLVAERAILEARARELVARHRAARTQNRAEAEGLRDELAAARAALALADERAGDGIVRSPGDGRFVLPAGGEWVGRYLRRGELVGYVVGPAVATARVVIPQESAALVQERTQGVALRLSRDLGRVVPAKVVREVPAASNQLPSAALGSVGGGPFSVDPTDPEGLRTLDSVFHLELALPVSAAVREIGGRVHARFDHGAEPIARRVFRNLRRILLGRLGV